MTRAAFTDREVQWICNAATAIRREGAKGKLTTLCVWPVAAPGMARALERGVLPGAYRAGMFAEMEASAARLEELCGELEKAVETVRAKVAVAEATIEAAEIARADARVRVERNAAGSTMLKAWLSLAALVVVLWLAALDVMARIGGAG